MIPRWVYFAVALSGLSYILFGFIEDRYNSKHQQPDQDEVLLRLIGHEILTAIGDDSSRILPVEKKTNREYYIRFEKVFSFQPDTLVDIVRSHLEGHAFSQSYVFQVLECMDKSVVYSFAIHADSSQNLIPCIGRRMPEACYMMRVAFQPTASYFKWYTILLFPFLLSLGYFWQKKKTPSPPSPSFLAGTDVQPGPFIELGAYRFDTNEQQLYWADQKIPLSAKESELLKLFLQAPNQLLDRDYLLKTIWEDQGVFTGRSLDVFVSKLRKKLAYDPNLTLVSVHGKGYKMEVNKNEEMKE